MALTEVAPCKDLLTQKSQEKELQSELEGSKSLELGTAKEKMFPAQRLQVEAVRGRCEQELKGCWLPRDEQRVRSSPPRSELCPCGAFSRAIFQVPARGSGGPSCSHSAELQPPQEQTIAGTLRKGTISSISAAVLSLPREAGQSWCLGVRGSAGTAGIAAASAPKRLFPGMGG